MDKNFKILLGGIFIILLLIICGYSLSRYLNKSLTSTQETKTPQGPQGPTTPPSGTIGYMCQKVQENGQIDLTAPVGAHFTKYIFADYGKPGDCTNPTRDQTCSLFNYNMAGIDQNHNPFRDPQYYYPDPANNDPAQSSKKINMDENKLTHITFPVNFTYMTSNPCDPNWATVKIEYIYD